MLIRRRIDAAHNFANKSIFFACNGVHIRRRVSHKADTKEGGRTARNSRNASRAERKFYRLQHNERRACLMIHGKQLRGGAASRAYNGGEARGRDIGKGQGCAPWWGGYKGGGREKAGAGGGRQNGTTR